MDIGELVDKALKRLSEMSDEEIREIARSVAEDLKKNTEPPDVFIGYATCEDE